VSAGGLCNRLGEGGYVLHMYTLPLLTPPYTPLPQSAPPPNQKQNSLISADLRNEERGAAGRTLACALSIAVAAGAVVALLLEVRAGAFGGVVRVGRGGAVLSQSQLLVAACFARPTYTTPQTIPLQHQPEPAAVCGGLDSGHRRQPRARRAGLRLHPGQGGGAAGGAGDHGAAGALSFTFVGLVGSVRRQHCICLRLAAVTSCRDLRHSALSTCSHSLSISSHPHVTSTSQNPPQLAPRPQAALLAQQDSLTPAVTTAVAVSVSLVGNILAVGVLGMGIIGAASTTVATQLVGCAALVWFSSTKADRLRPALIVPRVGELLRRGRGALGSCGGVRVHVCVVYGRSIPNPNPNPTHHQPDDLVGFARTMGPLAVAYVCKNCCYLVLQTAAAGLDTVRLAAHQAVFSYWNLLAFTTAPLEQISLAFVPAAKPGWQRRSAVGFVLGLGVAVGVVSGLLSAAVPLLAPWALTRDAMVWPHMASVSGLALGAMLLTAADVASTGVLLACRCGGRVMLLPAAGGAGRMRWLQRLCQPAE
jgi:hypothetical protein